MKYWLFGNGDAYHKEGGFESFISAYDSLDDAKIEAARRVALNGGRYHEDAIEWATIVEVNDNVPVRVFEATHNGSYGTALKNTDTWDVTEL